MEQHIVERRRGRRIKIQAPLRIRRDDAMAVKVFDEHVTTDLSLAGVYFETEAPPAAVNDVVVAAVAIPEAQQKEFPFTRIAGRSRVVRVEELPPQGAQRRRRFGIALEFGDDVTALTTIPARG